MPPFQTTHHRETRRARRQVLTEWRRVDLTPAEIALRSPARAAADLVPRVVTGLRLDQRVAESQILKVWQQVIDPVIVAHAQPAGLFRKTLFVNVDSNAWLSEIVRYRRREIIERIQHAMGKETVAKISFRVG